MNGKKENINTEKSNIAENICNFAESHFIKGNYLVQIKNFRDLISFVGCYNFDLNDADKVINSSKKINEMLFELLKMKDYSSLMESELFYLLAIVYAKNNNIELKIAEEKNEELLFCDTEYMNTDSVEQYMGEIRYDVLSEEEERNLFIRYEHGDEEAKNEIILHNLRLVVSIAKRKVRRGVEFLDLIQEGNIGLEKAIRKFKYRKGYKFSTYATWWIRQSMDLAIANYSRSIRVPVHMHEILCKVKAFICDYSQTHYGEAPSVDVISKSLGISSDKVISAMNIKEIISLNTPIEGEDDFDCEMQDFVKDANADTFENDTFLKEFREAFYKVRILTDKERTVITYRYGLDGEESKTLAEIGNMYGITRERVKQIEKRALNKLYGNRIMQSFAVDYIPSEDILLRR